MKREGTPMTRYRGGLPLAQYIYMYPAPASFSDPPWKNADQWPVVRF